MVVVVKMAVWQQISENKKVPNSMVAQEHETMSVLRFCDTIFENIEQFCFILLVNCWLAIILPQPKSPISTEKYQF